MKIVFYFVFFVQSLRLRFNYTTYRLFYGLELNTGNITYEIVRKYIEKQKVLKWDDNFKAGDGKFWTAGLLADTP